MNPKIYFEMVPYNHPEFPVYISKGIVSPSIELRMHNNWHDDIEFIRVMHGHTFFDVNGNIVRLNEGDGLFINSNQIHHTLPLDNAECSFICIAFQPLTLCNARSFEEKYITPILTNPAISYHVFHKDIDWENRVLCSIQKIYDIRETDSFELKFHGLFFNIWSEIFTHFNFPHEPSSPCKYNTSLKKMILYIKEHYKEKITLDNIAFSGDICKTNCNMIFKKYTGRSPIGYLNYHRLVKAIELMKSTDKTLTQICYETGFSGLSYFSETFRKIIGCTPGEYKKQKF